MPVLRPNLIICLGLALLLAACGEKKISSRSDHALLFRLPRPMNTPLPRR